MTIPTYIERVLQLESEGLTTSDAQGVADVEVAEGKCLPDTPPSINSMNVHGTITGRMSGKVENKSNTPKGALTC